MSSMTFNSANSTVAFCHQEGASLYNLNGTDPVPHVEIDPPLGNFKNVLIVERVGNSALCFIVCARHPTLLMIYKTNSAEFVGKGQGLSFTTPIKSVRSNNQKLAVCLVDWIVLYELTPTLTQVRKIPIGKYISPGLFDMCQGDQSLIVYPAKDPGYVRLYSASKLRDVNMFKVHESKITALRLNEKGTLLATASQKGTVIRVLDVATGNVLYNFCRSLLREASVYSLAFSNDDRFLASTSNSGTVHLFELREKGQGNAITSISENLGIGFVGNYLNTYFGEYTKQVDQYIPEPIARPKSIAAAKVSADVRSDVAIKMIGGVPFVLVALADGEFIVFRYNNEADLELMDRLELGRPVNRSSSEDSDSS